MEKSQNVSESLILLRPCKKPLKVFRREKTLLKNKTVRKNPKMYCNPRIFGEVTKEVLRMLLSEQIL